MDVPVVLVVGLAYAASLWHTVLGRGEVYFDSVVMFTFFLLTGRYLEMPARHDDSVSAHSVEFGALVGLAVRVFFWVVRNGQFEDMEGPAYRILMDDDGPGAGRGGAHERDPGRRTAGSRTIGNKTAQLRDRRVGCARPGSSAPPATFYNLLILIAFYLGIRAWIGKKL